MSRTFWPAAIIILLFVEAVESFGSAYCVGNGGVWRHPTWALGVCAPDPDWPGEQKAPKPKSMGPTL